MDLTDNQIRQLCTGDVFDRAVTYREENRIHQLDRFDKTITAAVQGSQPSPYTVDIDLGESEITASCTCPYDWGGYCKHIIAVLLELGDADCSDEKERVQRVLREAPPEDLREFLMAEFETNPDVGHRFLLHFDEQEPKSLHDYKREMAQEYRFPDEQGYRYEGPDLSEYGDLAEGHRRRGDPLEAATVYRALIECRIENMDMVEDSQAGNFDREFEALLDCLLAADLSQDDKREYIDYLFEQWTTDDGYYPEFRHAFEDGLEKLVTTAADRRYWADLIAATLPEEFPDNERYKSTGYYAARDQVLTLAELLECLDEESRLRDLYEQYYRENPDVCQKYVEWLDGRGDRTTAIDVAEAGLNASSDAHGLHALLADLYEGDSHDAFKRHATTLYLERGDWEYYERLKQACSDAEWEQLVTEFETELQERLNDGASGGTSLTQPIPMGSGSIPQVIELYRRENRLADAFDTVMTLVRGSTSTEESTPTGGKRAGWGLRLLQEHREAVAEYDTETYYETYETLLEPYLANQTGRDHYRTVIDHLTEMRELGHDEAFAAFVTHLTDKHANRPAFLDELEQAGL